MTNISNDARSSSINNNEAVRDAARPNSTGRKKTNKNKFNVMDISNHRDDDVVPKNMMELEEDDEFHFEGADYLLKALSGGLVEEMDDSSLSASDEALFTQSPGGLLRRPKKTNISPRRPRTEAVKAKSQFTSYPMENLPL